MVINLEEQRAKREQSGAMGIAASPLGIRMAAFIIDLVVCALLCNVTCWWFFHYCQAIYFPGITLVIPPVVFIAYFAAESKGNTIGKALFGLRAGTISGCPISQKTAVVRACLVGLGLLGLGIPFLFAGDPDNRRPFQDVLTGTSVHKTQRQDCVILTYKNV